MPAGSGTALTPAASVAPKFDSRIVRSLMSTVASPLKSPPLQDMPVWPKSARTMVRSLTSTWPSRSRTKKADGRDLGTPGRR